MIVGDDGSIEVITQPEAFSDVEKAMTESKLEPVDAEVTMRPATTVELDVEDGQKILRFLDVLEDLDDTQEVYSNAEIPAEAYD